MQTESELAADTVKMQLLVALAGNAPRVPDWFMPVAGPTSLYLVMGSDLSRWLYRALAHGQVVLTKRLLIEDVDALIPARIGSDDPWTQAELDEAVADQPRFEAEMEQVKREYDQRMRDRLYTWPGHFAMQVLHRMVDDHLNYDNGAAEARIDEGYDGMLA